jgi:hypothetical protein
MGPVERVATISTILEDPEFAPKLRPSDHKELALANAVSFSQLGAYEKALPHWQSCIDFNTKYCPPNDEGTVCYALQAALCAAAVQGAGSKAAAAHTSMALQTHAIAFGPGVALFETRFKCELGGFNDLGAIAIIRKLVSSLSVEL